MPLNPDLFFSLRRRFAEVKISNEGEPMVCSLYGGKEQKIYSGEYYRVCCPYCGDKRFRLYINYRWNTMDKEGKPYGRNLITCFNEACGMADFNDMLQTYISGRSKVQVCFDPNIAATLQWKQAYFPGQGSTPGVTVPLNKLPENHPAMQYLIRRNFNPYQLYDQWDLHYCVEAPDDGSEDCLIPGTEIHARLVRERIMIPMYREGVMVGWQARSLDPEEKKIKYYTMPGFKKSTWLYNNDRAKQYPFGFIFEGVTDVWRCGPCAVSLLGHKISYLQRCLIHNNWASGGVCIALDKDALEDMQKLSQNMDPKAFRYGLFFLKDTPGYEDPGAMPTRELWSLIEHYASVAGIKLPI